MSLKTHALPHRIAQRSFGRTTLGIYTDATTRSPDAPDGLAYGLAYGLALFFMLICIGQLSSGFSARN